jgi:Mrp family chromosome partitioning ATPase/capsular polysaccharide biosynthesis protein
MNEQDLQSEELDLRAYLRPMWRRKWIILAIVVVAAGGTYFLSNRQAKSYVSSGTIFVQVADPATAATNPATSGAPSPIDLQNAAQLLTSPAVARAASQILGKPVSQAGSVTATAATGNSFITVTGTSGSPTLAARLVNVYIQAYLASRTQALIADANNGARSIQLQLNKLPAHLARNSTLATTVGTARTSLTQTLETYRATAAHATPGAQQIAIASPPGAPVSPKPTRDAIFGGAVGLVLGIIAAFALELLDRRLLGVAALEAIFGRPVLAVLPHVRDPTPLVAGDAPVVPSPFLEQLRRLAVFLKLTNRSTESRTMVVTSTLPQEGKSTLTRDLAIIYAEAGSRVLVIDCDLRRPSMERLFGVEPERGLVHILRDGAPLADVAVRGAPTAVSDEAEQADPVAQMSIGLHLDGFVDVVTHGEIVDSPLGLTSSDQMRRLLEESAAAYDLVLIDTAPLLVVADTVPLLEVVDGVLLVARLGKTTRAAAMRFGELIERLGAVNLFGVIANDLRSENEDGYGYYGYGGYGYGYGNGYKARREQNGKTPRKKKRRSGATAGTGGSGVATVPVNGSGAERDASSAVPVANEEPPPSSAELQESAVVAEGTVVLSPIPVDELDDVPRPAVDEPNGASGDAETPATGQSASSARGKRARRQRRSGNPGARKPPAANSEAEAIKPSAGTDSEEEANKPSADSEEEANKPSAGTDSEEEANKPSADSEEEANKPSADSEEEARKPPARADSDDDVDPDDPQGETTPS